MIMGDSRMTKAPRTFQEWRSMRKSTASESGNRLLQHAERSHERSTPSKFGGSPRREQSGPDYTVERPGRMTRKLTLPPTRVAKPPSQRSSSGDIYQTSADKWLSTTFYQHSSASFFRYDPQAWGPTLNFSVTPFMMVPWAIITVVTLLLTTYVELVQPELKAWMSMPMDAHVVMGGALSFLVVFRTNASYDRWWEARCAWQTVVSTCRGMAAQVAPTLRDDAAQERCLMQLMALTVSLKAWLRDTPIDVREIGGRMDPLHIAELNASSCPPLLSIRAINKTVRTNLPAPNYSPRTGFDDASLGSTVLAEASSDLRTLTTAIGVCERIKLTPMTYGYIATLRSFLVLWLGTLPLTLVGEYGWLAPPALSLIAFLFLTVEQMAIEIEQPFGDDANDLPIEDYILHLEATLLEMLPGRSQQITARDDVDERGGLCDAPAKGTNQPTPPNERHGAAARGVSPVREGPISPTISPSRMRSMTTSTIKRIDYEYDDVTAPVAVVGVLTQADATPLAPIATPLAPIAVAPAGREQLEGREQSCVSRVSEEVRRLDVARGLPPPTGGESPDGPYRA